MGVLRRCETEPGARGSSGGGGESARCDEGTTRARGPEEETREMPLVAEKETREVQLNPEKETREVPLDPEEETREVTLDPEDETREVPLDPEQETREVPLDPEEGTQEAPSDPAEETRKAPSDRENEAQAPPWDHEEEILEAPSDSKATKDAAGLAETDLEGAVVPARRKLTISGNLPPNSIKAHVESAGARRRGGSSTTKLFSDKRGRRLRECGNVRRGGHDEFAAAKGGDLRHFDAEQEFLKADIDEDI